MSCCERGGDFFQGEGWCSLYIKNKLSLKYLTTKKVYINKNVFFCHNNLNWKILTKNLVTVKRWDGVKDEKF